MRYRRQPGDLLHTAVFRAARRQWSQLAMADSTGQKLTYGRALTAALALSRVVGRLTEGQESVAVLLPASVGGALANIAILAAGRVPVNLNFTAGQATIDAAIEQCKIRTIITSRRFLDKASIPATPAMVFLEDLGKQISGPAKLSALLQAKLLPLSMLASKYGRGKTPDMIATIIFSSGSTGMPKGVMISHANILSNVESLATLFQFNDDACFIGVLPFFHSFGFTGTLWLPLLLRVSVAYHPNPMDAKTIGELADKYGATMLISTPTFCQSYVRRITKEQFSKLQFAIVGAEKLRDQLAKAFKEQFGVALLEGYGVTEMAPVVSVNRPPVDAEGRPQISVKPGSVGHPIPGVEAKVVDQHTGEGPLIDKEGLLLVRGPNMMLGYLGQPERTAEVIRDGWYSTGDIAKIDRDGFIFITDRLSRFSKIGGEMVPHIKLEDTINEILGEPCCAVSAVPDATKGERLVAFFTRKDITPEALWERLTSTDLPRLWLPRRDSLIQIDAIPTLGTGKVDLRALKQLALQKAEQVSAST